jgi:hypothetical protein
MPSAREVGPRYAGIHEPPVDGADGDAAPSEEDVARADAKHPQTEATDKKPKN